MDSNKMQECIEYGCKRWFEILEEMSSKEMFDKTNNSQVVSVSVSVLASIQARFFSSIVMSSDQETALNILEDIFLRVRKRITDLDKDLEVQLYKMFKEHLQQINDERAA